MIDKRMVKVEEVGSETQWIRPSHAIEEGYRAAAVIIGNDGVIR
jgi:hypothetical protein